MPEKCAVPSPISGPRKCSFQRHVRSTALSNIPSVSPRPASCIRSLYVSLNSVIIIRDGRPLPFTPTKSRSCRGSFFPLLVPRHPEPFSIDGARHYSLIVHLLDSSNLFRLIRSSGDEVYLDESVIRQTRGTDARPRRQTILREIATVNLVHRAVIFLE